MMNRRGLITGLVSLMGAPVVVRADSLMRVRGDVFQLWEYRCPILPDPAGPCYPNKIAADYFQSFIAPNGYPWTGVWTFFGKTRNLYNDAEIGFRREPFERETDNNFGFFDTSLASPAMRQRLADPLTAAQRTGD